MSDEIATCKLCGEPMPEGEEMFHFHGYSGPCPKQPPLDRRVPPVPSIEAVIEYVHREVDDKFWIMIRVDRIECNSVGPFDTAHDDLLQMMRSVGAKDLPSHAQ